MFDRLFGRRPQRGKKFGNRTRLQLERLESRAMMHGEGMLAGAVFLDANSNGTRDTNELGVPGVVVNLTRTAPATPAFERSTITDNNGQYEFDELEAGTYRLNKRPVPITVDGTDATTVSGAVSAENQVSNIVLTDDQVLTGNNFVERSVRSEFINVAWFFASSQPPARIMREMIAASEMKAGNSDLANEIRSGGTEPPDETNDPPVAADDNYSVARNTTLTVTTANSLLVNDSDPESNPLTTAVVTQPTSGTLTLSTNGTFQYVPNNNFTGNDSFTYRASDGTSNSNTATVRITVTTTPTQNQPFGAVTTGSFEAAGLLGTRTDLVSGAPPITAVHRDGDLDYTGYSNPPTYGDHHGLDLAGTDVNPGITPRPTGIYTTEQPEEDLIHNLEHGHVWISYNPTLISSTDLAALQQLVRDGTTNANGGGVGVILTPRAANDSMIALASWARLLKLSTYDPATIRSFVETNRGKAPEGFITP